MLDTFLSFSLNERYKNAISLRMNRTHTKRLVTGKVYCDRSMWSFLLLRKVVTKFLNKKRDIEKLWLGCEQLNSRLLCTHPPPPKSFHTLSDTLSQRLATLYNFLCTLYFSFCFVSSSSLCLLLVSLQVKCSRFSQIAHPISKAGSGLRFRPKKYSLGKAMISSSFTFQCF